jgi:signal transduction histidine kinase
LHFHYVLIKISREGETLYQSDKWESHLEKYIHQNQITLINAEVWLLSLAPGVELYQSHIHEARQILFYTLLFSILFFGLILFAVRNNAHLRLLEERKQAEEEILEINKGLEQRIDERTAELEAVNRELESFAYSVSHDLRAPLRAINGFSEHLLAGHGDQLDKKGAHYLSRIISASLHMSELIDSLLVLSRVIRVDIKKEQFDLGELADQVVAVIQENEPKRHVKVHIEKGIPVRGDKQLLRIALENLLSNAWKFSGSSPQPEIEVGAESINNEQVFYISDNGVGFNMASVGKLFTPFQRLHSADEFPGTGIGLATVQRIINRHGGRIWAESELGHGAKFYFTLQSLPPG